jgi:hypothetical protein
MFQISGFFLFRIFALWRFNVFGKTRFPSVESKIFVTKRKIHLETTKLEKKNCFQWMMTTLATNKNSWKKHCLGQLCPSCHLPHT